MKILAINPGSTSTKIGIFEDETQLFEKTIRYSNEELKNYKNIIDQYEFRKNSVLDALSENGLNVSEIDGFVGRGGLLKPISGGTYEVNELMLKDLKECKMGEHASNLGGIIAYELANINGKRSFIVDPVVVDELLDVARVSGHKDFQRVSIFHALNQKAIGREYAKSIGKSYEDLNLIIAHLGGGISVGAHKKGRVIDVNNALDGEGAFSPERSGTLPLGDMVRLCFSGKYDYKEIMNMIKGKGGLISYFENSDVRTLMNEAKDDENKKLVLEAMAYQVSKEIGAYAAVLDGKVDGIILTGGIAHNNKVTEYIENKVKFISKVIVFPGEDELRALVQGALRVLNGNENSKIYC